jgi:hypothetical protein
LIGCDKLATLVYKNTYGQSVTLAQNHANPFWLSKIAGFGGAKNDVNTVKSPDQDGETDVNASLEKSERTITGTIIAANARQLEEYHRELITAFSTKQSGVLEYIYGDVDKSCSCKVESVAFGEIDGGTQEYDITILCPNPFWQDISPTVDEIALWLPEFEFLLPDGFEFPDDGMEFGERAESLIVDVQNPGDVPCGMKIIFTATGTLENPSVLNVNTREYFKMLKTMHAGEMIEINTKFGEKAVTGYLNGDSLNYFNDADLPASTFLQLQPGSNPIRYNADSGLDNLNVTIRYSPQYLGV